MGDFRIKMISCKLISTKEILALKKKKAYNAEKTNKQTKHTQESHTNLSTPEVWGKKILPKPNHPYPSLTPLCASFQKNKTSCGEKQQQQPELPKGEFRPARAMCM